MFFRASSSSSDLDWEKVSLIEVAAEEATSRRRVCGGSCCCDELDSFPGEEDSDLI